MTFPFVVVPLLGVAVITAAIEDFGKGVVFGAAVLAALIYIATQIRKGVRTVDTLGALPDEMKALKKQATEQSERQEAEHAEMLSMVTTVDEQVKGLGKRLDRIEKHAGREREHVAGLTRELGVSVRSEPRDDDDDADADAA